MEKFAYEKLLEKEKLTIDELPTDAKVGIKAINKVKKMLDVREQRSGKITVPVETLNKLKANDKWVVREILDYIEGKDSKQDDAPPNEPEAIIEAVKDADEKDEKKNDKNGDATNVSKNKETKDENTADERGIAIDKELEVLYKADKKKLSAQELKSEAPKTYAIIFDSYEADKPNGVETTYYKAIEDSKETFIITKL